MHIIKTNKKINCSNDPYSLYLQDFFEVISHNPIHTK